MKCPVRSHSPWGLCSPPWLSLAGQVLCLHSRGGIVPAWAVWWWHRAAPGTANPGAALFTGRCLFPHYTFLGFFYTFIQPGPGCVVSLFALWVLYVQETGNRATSWRLKGSLSCTRNWSGHDNVWQDWMLRGGSCCVRVFQFCRGRGGGGMQQHIHTSDLFSTPDLLFAYLSEKNRIVWHIWRPLEASQ